MYVHFVRGQMLPHPPDTLPVMVMVPLEEVVVVVGEIIGISNSSSNDDDDDV